MTATLLTRAVALFLGLVLTLGAAGCSDQPEQPGTESDASPKAALTVHSAPTLRSLGPVKLGQVEGRLPRRERQRVLRAVAGTVDRWLTSAYTGGTYPRNDFRTAFATFTPGAQRQARADRKLLSNAGAGLTDVRPTARRIAVDVVAANRRCRRHRAGAPGLRHLGQEGPHGSSSAAASSPPGPRAAGASSVTT